MDSKLVREIEMLQEQTCFALSDPTRLLIIYALRQRPRYVCEIAAMLDIAQPTISRHLKILRERGLVETRRESHAIYYSLTDDRLIQALDLMRDVLRDRLVEQVKLVEAAALDAVI
ncbi:MAG: winged helix-turn-helix transcriptional regulator [Anaerolineae bacterium]|nr:winged helix-turn-helix transcriptional regulator [Anaerolineae bacterium]